MKNLEMTHVKLSAKQTKEIVKAWRDRLNILLRLPSVDPWVLTNGRWQNLLGDLHFALYGTQRNPGANEDFEKAATRESIREVYTVLKEYESVPKSTLATLKFQLAEQILEISHDVRRNRFYSRFRSKHFPTMFYMMLSHLLEISDVGLTDIRECANCKVDFVPQRKPRKGVSVYCSTRCRNVVAARNYRAKARKAKKKKRGNK